VENKLDYQGISATLLVPLWGRAEITKRFPEFLKDDEAVRLVETLPYDFSDIREGYKGEYWLAASATRAYRFDKAIREYIAEHPKAAIVNIGAGLDTTFSRVDNGQISWYDLDLPEIIDIRRAVIPERQRARFISRSAFDFKWLDEIDFKKEDGIFFIAGGFFYYFKPEENGRLVAELARRFCGGQLLFDAGSKSGVRVSNKKVVRSGNKEAEMLFYTDDPDELYAWSDDIAEVELTPYYTQSTRKAARWSAHTKFMMFFGDLLEMVKLVRIRFED
jgi:O-methyltransferase involved in polyketide biosynthesis